MNSKTTFRKSLSVLILTMSFTQAFTQDNHKKDTLQIGDPAPPLKYSKWIKGSPVPITGSKIYVIELWATWCGPCIAAMPHLSALAEQYAGKAEFIGCNVAEGAHTDDNNKPYEFFLPKIEKFVTGHPNRMNYHVIADNNSQDMLSHWLRAAGLNSIPCTFVVQNNRVMWIGNPNKLDTVLADLAEGRFDLEANKKKADYDRAEMQTMIQTQRESSIAISAALKVKDFDKAFQLMDDYSRYEYLQRSMQQYKFATLLDHFGEEKAMDYAKEIFKASKKSAQSFATTILNHSGLAPKTYQFAAECYGMDEPLNPFTQDKIAEAYHKAGDREAAIKAQKQAVMLAKETIKDPKWEGQISPQTIIEFEARLKKYESLL